MGISKPFPLGSVVTDFPNHLTLKPQATLGWGRSGGRRSSQRCFLQWSSTNRWVANVQLRVQCVRKASRGQHWNRAHERAGKHSREEPADAGNRLDTKQITVIPQVPVLAFRSQISPSACSTCSKTEQVSFKRTLKDKLYSPSKE